jgi:hypothetical protein
MRSVAVAMTLLLLTASAHAQINLWADEKLRDPEAETKKQEIDKAYRDKLQAIPAKPAPAANDPWGNVRASETPQGKTQAGSKNR